MGENEQIIDKIGMNKPIILRERVSAYNINQFKKRSEFAKLLNFAFDYDKVTIKDLFMVNYQQKQINLYAWDSHRFMRNIGFSIQFLLLCDFFKVNVYTHKDGKLNHDYDEDTPSTKLLRYIIFLIHSYSGEEYSYTTSQNIRKSVKFRDGIKIGTKKNPDGIKWGKPFTDADGSRIELSTDEIVKLQERIMALDKEFKQYRGSYYPDIIAAIVKEYGVKISKAYISWLKSKES